MAGKVTIKEKVIAYLNQDNAELIGDSIQEMGKSGLLAQIAVKEAHTHLLQNALKVATDKYEESLIHKGQPIKDYDSYVQAILNADTAVKAAQKELTRHEDSIKVLKTALKNF